MKANHFRVTNVWFSSDGRMNIWFGIRSSTTTSNRLKSARALSGDQTLLCTTRKIKILFCSSLINSILFMVLLFSDISYGIGSCHETSCLIQNVGAITCIEPCSYTAHCKTDFSLWPYDRQNCSMIFGPWMNNEDEIDYVSEVSELSLEAVAQHTQWKLISGSVSKKVFSISSKDKKFITKFPNLIYSFTIERHASLITKVIGCKLIGLNLRLSFQPCSVLFYFFSVMCAFD